MVSGLFIRNHRRQLCNPADGHGRWSCTKTCDGDAADRCLDHCVSDWFRRYDLPESIDEGFHFHMAGLSLRQFPNAHGPIGSNSKDNQSTRKMAVWHCLHYFSVDVCDVFPGLSPTKSGLRMGVPWRIRGRDTILDGWQNSVSRATMALGLEGHLRRGVFYCILLVLRCISSPASPLTGRSHSHRDEHRDQVSGLILLFMLCDQPDDSFGRSVIRLHET